MSPADGAGHTRPAGGVAGPVVGCVTAATASTAARDTSATDRAGTTDGIPGPGVGRITTRTAGTTDPGRAPGTTDPAGPAGDSGRLSTDRVPTVTAETAVVDVGGTAGPAVARDDGTGALVVGRTTDTAGPACGADGSGPTITGGRGCRRGVVVDVGVAAVTAGATSAGGTTVGASHTRPAGGVAGPVVVRITSGTAGTAVLATGTTGRCRTTDGVTGPVVVGLTAGPAGPAVPGGTAVAAQPTGATCDRTRRGTTGRATGPAITAGIRGTVAAGAAGARGDRPRARGERLTTIAAVTAGRAA